MLAKIAQFFSSPFFCIIGGISTLVMIIGFCYTVWLVVRGVVPVWYRLGIGLSRNKIAIFSKNKQDDLSNMIIDSKIFGKNNLKRVSSKESLRSAEGLKIFLVHWNDFKDNLDEILSLKKDTTALIIYAPTSEGRIDNISMEKINNERNSVVVNFRGRLLNDILTSMMTVSLKS